MVELTKTDPQYKMLKNPMEAKSRPWCRIFWFTLISLLGITTIIIGLFCLVASHTLFYKQIGGIVLGIGCLMLIILSAVYYHINTRERLTYDSKDSYKQRAYLSAIHNRSVRELEFKRPIYKNPSWTKNKTRSSKMVPLNNNNNNLKSANSKEYIIFEALNRPFNNQKEQLKNIV